MGSNGSELCTHLRADSGGIVRSVQEFVHSLGLIRPVLQRMVNVVSR